MTHTTDRQYNSYDDVVRGREYRYISWYVCVCVYMPCVCLRVFGYLYVRKAEMYAFKDLEHVDKCGGDNTREEERKN